MKVICLKKQPKSWRFYSAALFTKPHKKQWNRKHSSPNISSLEVLLRMRLKVHCFWSCNWTWKKNQIFWMLLQYKLDKNFNLTLRKMVFDIFNDCQTCLLHWQGTLPVTLTEWKYIAGPVVFRRPKSLMLWNWVHLEPTVNLQGKTWHFCCNSLNFRRMMALLSPKAVSAVLPRFLELLCGCATANFSTVCWNCFNAKNLSLKSL